MSSLEKRTGNRLHIEQLFWFKQIQKLYIYIFFHFVSFCRVNPFESNLCNQKNAGKFQIMADYLLEAARRVPGENIFCFHRDFQS